MSKNNKIKENKLKGKKINTELDEKLLNEGIISLLKYEENKLNKNNNNNGNLLENYSKPILLQVIILFLMTF